MTDANRQYLLRTLLGEAAKQPDEGMAAVGHVIMNRLKGGRYGNDVRSVVTAKHQFEPWNDPAARKRMLSYQPGDPAYDRAARIADGVLSGQIADPTGGADHFLNEEIVRQRRGGTLPSWVQPMAASAHRIGDHTFYGGSGGTTLAGGEGGDWVEVTDPAILRQLNGEGDEWVEVTDPAILAQLNGEEPSNERTGVGEAIGRGALQGVSAGFSDEIYANQMPDPRQRFADALAKGKSVEQAREHANAPAVSSDLRNEIYGERLEGVRSANRQAEEDQPVAYVGGEVAGAVGTALVPGGAAARLMQGGNAAARIVVAGGSAGAQGAAYGFGEGEGGFEERLTNAGDTAYTSAAFGVAVPFLGRAASKLFSGKVRASAQLREIAPAVDELESSASNLFRQAEASGVVISQQTMENLADKVWNRALKAGARDKLHPGAMAALQELRDAAGGNTKISDLMSVRRVLQMGANDLNNKDNSRLVGGIVDIFDDFLMKLKPRDFLNGGPRTEAVEQWKAAREIWHRSIKAGVVEGAFDRAALAASGLENGLRNEFRALAKNKRIQKMFNKDEIAAIRQVATGSLSGNALRKLSSFGYGLNGERNFLGGSIGVGVGALLLGPAGAVAVPALGYAAAKGADKATRKAAETVRAMAATGQSPALPQITNRAAERWLLPMFSGTAAAGQ